MAKKAPQMLIIIMCWLIYSLSYLGRYSYNANITLIIDEYGITKAQAGLVTTCFFFSYGVGQVVNGLLSSKYNKKWIFPIVLLVSSVINLAVFFGAPFYSIKYLWLINGFAQSCLWSGFIAVISKTVDEKHIGIAMLFMSTTTCVGTIEAYSLGALFSFLNNYKLLFAVGALVMTVLGILWFIIYNPLYEVNTVEEKKAETNEKKGGGGFLAVLILLGFFAILHNIPRDGLTVWAPDILKERYGMSDSISILLTVILPAMGVIGGFIAIFLNKYIKDFIQLALAIFAVGAVAMGCIVLFPGMNVIIAVICFGVVVCMMHGINNIVNTIGPLKLRDRVDSGKMAGVMNGFAYLGSTISSYGLGKIADIGGWQLGLDTLLALIIVAFSVGFIYILFNRKKL